MTSGLQGDKKWGERIDLEKWALGLAVEKVRSENLVMFVQDSKNQIIENLKYWKEENTIDVFALTLPDSFDSCRILKETVYPRHFINSTETFLAMTREKYYCIEEHWES